MNEIPLRSQTPATIERVEGEARRAAQDFLATEEPLEIHLAAGGEERTVAVTMRTPGNDHELAVGFLFAEGVISDRGQVAAIESVGAVRPGCSNVVRVELVGDELPDLAPLERHFFATSSCGVCGKAGLETLTLRGARPLPLGFAIASDVVRSLPDTLRGAQGVFDSTGGLHAAALFSASGELVAVREDVGRHNALDKLVGWALLEDRLPLSDGAVLVSGRSSFEILQKCLVAEVPVVASVSAPSSLAVDIARQFQITLIGFLRAGRFNVYAGAARLPA
ncbi:MAG: formate dehydrogenase accessory sulfurtransferase FdhD [Acidobacteriota bacterium]